MAAERLRAGAAEGDVAANLLHARDHCRGNVSTVQCRVSAKVTGLPAARLAPELVVLTGDNAHGVILAVGSAANSAALMFLD